MNSRFPVMLFELEAMSTAELFLLPPTPKEKKLSKTVLATFASYEQTPTPEPHPSLPAEACEVGWGPS